MVCCHSWIQTILGLSEEIIQIIQSHFSRHLLDMWIFRNVLLWDFPGSPVVKTSPSNAGGAVFAPFWGEIGSQMPQGLKKKHKNRSNIITNSIKTFKKWSTSKQYFLKKNERKKDVGFPAKSKPSSESGKGGTISRWGAQLDPISWSCFQDLPSPLQQPLIPPLTPQNRKPPRLAIIKRREGAGERIAEQRQQDSCFSDTYLLSLGATDFLSQVTLCLGDYPVCHWVFGSILVLYPLDARSSHDDHQRVQALLNVPDQGRVDRVIPGWEPLVQRADIQFPKNGTNDVLFQEELRS